MNCVPSVILIQLDTFITKIPGSAMYIVVTLIRAYLSWWIKRTGDEKIVMPYLYTSCQKIFHAHSTEKLHMSLGVDIRFKIYWYIAA